MYSQDTKQKPYEVATIYTIYIRIDIPEAQTYISTTILLYISIQHVVLSAFASHPLHIPYTHIRCIYMFIILPSHMCFFISFLFNHIRICSSPHQACYMLETTYTDSQSTSMPCCSYFL